MKIQVSINEKLLKKVDRHCEESGFTRSAFITYCLKQHFDAESSKKQLRKWGDIVEKVVADHDGELSERDKRDLDFIRMISDMVK